MTTYGTIPTSSSPGGGGPSSNIEYHISRGKERIKAGLGERRPWKMMLNIHCLGLPHKVAEATARVRTNVAYFRLNYAIIMLTILFLSLLWHPISLIVFIVMMATWLFLYFLRDEPLVLFGRLIDDRVVLIVLAVLTIVFVSLTHVFLNVLVSIFIGAAVVVVHGVFRKTDDLYMDEEATGLMSTGAAAAAAASSSSS